MQLSTPDLLILGVYVAFAISVGVFMRQRASQTAETFFLAGRKLPWWVVGTSMVATSFAADTPLVITGWVRDSGIWQNWLWWCFAVGGMLTVFLFSRYWRRLGVMTQAEFAELRYGGREASALRATLGVFHAFLTNPIVLCWVLLAAVKISDVLFDIDKVTALGICCAICLSYSLMSGFWGVAITDLVQFVLAMTGAIALATITWNEVGGLEVVLQQIGSLGDQGQRILDFFPSPGDPLDKGFWTVPLAACAVYLGVSWWATYGVDGGPVVVQRIAASRSPAHGSVGVLWYSIAHYALRPWLWVAVALASLVVVPHVEFSSPASGTIHQIDDIEDGSGQIITVMKSDGQTESLTIESPEGWVGVQPLLRVKVGDEVPPDRVVASTDSEKAYVVMMVRYLPAGLLGLVVASLLAAFMSTIDTHVNLAASYYVNDIHRRFISPNEEPGKYVTIARIASVFILLEGALLASFSSSISDLFTFFLAFLGGVGPIYMLRWLWWRVTAWTEIAAMLTSSLSTTVITFFFSKGWPDTPLTPVGDGIAAAQEGGVMSPEGRIIIVATLSTAVALIVTYLRKSPDPERLVPFYEKVRPAGAWGPVQALSKEVPVNHEGLKIFAGVVGGLSLVWGLTMGLGALLLAKPWSATSLGLAGVGAVIVALTLPSLLKQDESLKNSAE